MEAYLGGLAAKGAQFEVKKFSSIKYTLGVFLRACVWPLGVEKGNFCHCLLEQTFKEHMNWHTLS